jgi:hypothetical protein
VKPLDGDRHDRCDQQNQSYGKQFSSRERHEAGAASSDPLKPHLRHLLQSQGRQGDQIRRIFAQRAIVYCEQLHENYKSSPHFWGYFIQL